MTQDRVCRQCGAEFRGSPHKKFAHPLTAHTLCCSIYLGTEYIVRSEVELWIAVD